MTDGIMKKIIGIFVCVLLLFSCNKNNKAQNGNFENEPYNYASALYYAFTEEQADNNETTIANNSDEDLEYDDSKYDDSENDINSPYSAFFYVWKRYEKGRADEPYYSTSYTYIIKDFMTITSKSIKRNDYWEQTYDDPWSGLSGSYTEKLIIENTVWEPITSRTVNSIYGKKFDDIEIKNFLTGYKITGKPKGIEGTQLADDPAATSYSDSPKYNRAEFVFLHKDDPSKMLSFTSGHDDFSTSSVFEYHRIDR
jgi:hypothetical protein